jgi:hypothetical protein
MSILFGPLGLLHQFSPYIDMFLLKGAKYEGVGFEGKICGVSILRAGEVC